MSNKKLELTESKLSNALARLEELINDPIDTHKGIVDGTIQRFEFTFELFWKWLKLLLEQQGINTNFPKQVLQEAYKTHMIHDETIWLQMLNDRNLTSHTYNSDLAMSIYQHIKIYAPLIRDAFDKYKNKKY